MARVVKLLLTASVASAALYVGGKGYLHYKAQTLFDQVKAELSPFGELKHGGIISTVTGELGYNNIRFIARDGKDTLTIKSITLKAPNIGYLLFALSGNNDGNRLPEQLQFDVRGAGVDLDGPLMAQLDQNIAKAEPALATDAALCDESATTPAHYRALGYKRLTFDLHLDYRYYDSDASLILTLRAASHDVGSGDIALHLQDIPKLEARRLIGTMPSISKIELNYRDDGYSRRASDYCAKLKGMSVANYISAVSNESNAYYLKHWGFAPGPGLRRAYRTFLTDPGTLHIVARPPESLELQQLVRYSPATIPALLDTHMEVNGQNVEDLTITAIALQNQTPEHTPSSSQNDNGWRAAAKQAQKNEAHAPPAMHYRQVPLADLGHHIGQKVRITLRHNGIREGWLSQLSDHSLEIEQRPYRGNVTMVVERDTIDHVEVLR